MCWVVSITMGGAEVAAAPEAKEKGKRKKRKKRKGRGRKARTRRRRKSERGETGRTRDLLRVYPGLHRHNVRTIESITHKAQDQVRSPPPPQRFLYLQPTNLTPPPNLKIPNLFFVDIPIIIVPSALTSLITLYNAQDFLENAK